MRYEYQSPFDLQYNSVQAFPGHLNQFEDILTILKYAKRLNVQM